MSNEESVTRVYGIVLYKSSELPPSYTFTPAAIYSSSPNSARPAFEFRYSFLSPRLVLLSWPFSSRLEEHCPYLSVAQCMA